MFWNYFKQKKEFQEQQKKHIKRNFHQENINS